jgi:hypothetical protein
MDLAFESIVTFIRSECNEAADTIANGSDYSASNTSMGRSSGFLLLISLIRVHLWLSALGYR